MGGVLRGSVGRRRGRFVGAQSRADDLAGSLQDFAEPLAQLGVLAELLGENVSGSEQRVGGRGDLAIGINEIGSARIQARGNCRGAQDFRGQKLQSPRARGGGQGLLLGLEGQIQIFQSLGRAGRLDLLGQGFGQLSLSFDGAEDGLLALGEKPGLYQSRLDLPDLLLVQPAGLVLAVACDERDGVAFVEKLDDGFDLPQGESQTTCDMPQVDSYRIGHGVDRRQDSLDAKLGGVEA